MRQLKPSTTSKSLFSKKTTIRQHEHDYDFAVGSNIDGKEVLIQSDGKVNIQGSNVVADNNIAVNAKNIDIREAENRVYEQDFEQTKKSGLMSSSGIGFTIGSKKDTTETDQTKYYAAQSQVGSLNGNTTILAESQYHQSASAVTSVKGDVNIQAKQVDILAASDKYETNYKHIMEQKGFTIAVSTPIQQIINGVNAVSDSVKTVGESKNDRINAMSAANAGWGAYRTGQAVAKLGKSLQEMMANGTMPTEANVSVSITYGEQKNEETRYTQGTEANSSQVNAGGKATIIATGAGERSNINIVGSDVSGKAGTTLIADNDVIIHAQKQSYQERSKNKSSGYNAGVAVSYGSNGFAFGITAGGNYGKGYGNGDDISWRNSRIGNLNSKTMIISQNDSTIKGAQIMGKSVQINTKNLNIESLQDTMTYKGEQMNVSGQATIGYGASVSASYSQSKVNANYASVNEQSGIFVGDDGYQIYVKNHSDLKGAIVTSMDKAEQANKNRFITSTLTHYDIENHSDYSAKGFGLSGGFTIKGDFTIPLGGKPESTQTNQHDESMTMSEKDNRVIETIGDMGGKEMSSHQVEKPDTQRESNHDTQLNGIAGVLSQGNWGIAKGLATGVLGQVSTKGDEKSVTSSFISTKNIAITNSEKQQQLTGKTVDETRRAITQNNTHETLEKANIEQIKSDIERDLSIAQTFVNNLNEIGDKLHYEVEKNENNIVVKYKPESCNEPSCLQYFELDMEQLKNKESLTKDEAQILSRMYAHGIFNQTDKDRAEGGILYGGSDTLNNASLVVRKPYAGLAEELTYTVFERLRAGLDMPSILGASNASREQVTIWDKLNQYNQANPNDKVSLTHVAHSLGASSTKNAMNWANHKNINLKDTEANLVALGTSYPIHSDIQTGYFDSAKGLFGKTKLDYSIAPQDCVGTCLLIGRTKSTAENTNVGIPVLDLLPHHTLSYIKDKNVLNFYIKDEVKRNEKIHESQKIWNRDLNDSKYGPDFKTLE